MKSGSKYTGTGHRPPKPKTPSLAQRLHAAVQARNDWTPPFTRPQLEALVGDPKLAAAGLLQRIARGLLRADDVAKRYKRKDLIASNGWADPDTCDAEEILIGICGALTHRPHEWMVFAIPYGEPGDFEDSKGLRKWQAKLIEDIGGTLRAQVTVSDWDAIRRAVGSGHGAGKTGFASALILWGMSTSMDARVIVMANTEDQLKKRNWPDLQKHKRACITSHWFTITNTQLHAREEIHEQTWHAAATVWNENRLTSVQGLHQGGGGRRIIIVTDECSEHPPELWHALSGILIDRNVEIIWLATGNPTWNHGPFYDALMTPNSIWHPMFVDTRDVEELNQNQIQIQIREYGGIDTDLSRVRIRGLPPLMGDMGFFNRLQVEEAMKADPPQPDVGYPVIIGVDVARHGHDASVIAFRRNLDAKSFPPVKLRGLDTMQLAYRVADEAVKLRALGLRSVICVDGTGVGSGVVDRLKELNYTVVDAIFSAKASDQLMYANTRAEWHGKVRDALKHGLVIPDDKRLLEQMASVEYCYAPGGAILLEPKDDIRARLGYSPDELDALCLTYAAPLNIVDAVTTEETREDIWRREARERNRKAHQASTPEYDPTDILGDK